MPRHRSSRRYFCAIGALAAVTCIGAVTAACSEHMDSTPQEVFDSMRGSFQPAKAKGVHARYQWDLSGPQGGRMVDRRERRDLQDGKRKNRQSKCDFRRERQGLGRRLPTTKLAGPGLILPAD